MDTLQLSEKHRRSSAFLEIGLEGTDSILDDKLRNERPKLQMNLRRGVSMVDSSAIESVPPTPTTSSHPRPAVPRSLIPQISFMQVTLLIALLAVAFPIFYVPLTESRVVPAVAEAGVIIPRTEQLATLPAKRQTTSADVCKRWAGQSAVLNGTLYYYGGNAITTSDQTSNTWSGLRLTMFNHND